MNTGPVHYVADIETLSVSKCAAITSLGLARVRKDDSGKWFVDKDQSYYFIFPLMEQIRLGAETDTDTLRWWNSVKEVQSKTELLHSLLYTESLYLVLKNVSNKATHNGNILKEDIYLWGCGPSFDNAILSECYRRAKLECFWAFRNEGCLRTAGRLRPDIRRNYDGYLSHHALDDALVEAQWLADIQNAMGSDVTLLF